MSGADAKAIQGQDPKAQAFADLYPVLYAAETPISGSYVMSSAMCAAIADALHGLEDQRVLDVGCGYGTTTAAIASFAPRHITAVDSSPAMIELFQELTLEQDRNLDLWLRGKGAPEVLGDLYEPTLRHLQQRRAEFETGIFYRGSHQIRAVPLFSLVQSSLTLSPRLGMHDVIIGNNFLHWPVNQRRAELKQAFGGLADTELARLATIDALRPLQSVLGYGGLMVLMEPKDFVTFDDDQKRERDLEAHTMVAHPVFRKFHETFNRLLKAEYGIDRAVPKTTGLFPMSKFGSWCEDAGLHLMRTVHAEQTATCDPVAAFYVRLPMVLGGINIPFDEKIKLGKRTMQELAHVVTDEDRATPLQSQMFFFCLKTLD